MKTILYEQLPPELFNLIKRMDDELVELRRMIQEGETNMGVTEAEFNLVKERVVKVEEGIVELKEMITALGIDPEELRQLIANVGVIAKDMEVLKSFDRASETIMQDQSERLTTIETKHLTLSLAELTLPSTTITNLVLPETDEYLTTYVWSSSHPHIISQTGAVNRPTAAEGNISVVLTAAATYGKTELSKTFIISVTANEITDSERLDTVTNNLDTSIFTGTDNSTDVYITENQSLPTEIDGVLIAWASSNEGVLSSGGIVNRSPDSDEAVMLTATLTFGSETRTKTFSLIVERHVEPEPEPEPEPPVDPPDETDPEPEA